MATIINNLPKGNVKAPQGAIMKINQGEELHQGSFNNNTEFVLEFTPEAKLEDVNLDNRYVKKRVIDTQSFTIGNGVKVVDITTSNVEGEEIGWIQSTWGYAEVVLSPEAESFLNLFMSAASPIQSNYLIVDRSNNQYHLSYLNGYDLLVISNSNEDIIPSQGKLGQIFYVNNEFDQTITINGVQRTYTAHTYYAYCEGVEENSQGQVSVPSLLVFQNKQRLNFTNGQIYLEQAPESNYGSNIQIPLLNLNQYSKFNAGAFVNTGNNATYDGQPIEGYNLNNNIILLYSKRGWPTSPLDGGYVCQLATSYNDIWKYCYSITPGVELRGSTEYYLCYTTTSINKIEVLAFVYNPLLPAKQL